MKKSRGRSSTARAKPALTAAEEFYGGETAGDSYVPLHGNRGYRVLRYELDLHYRVPSNRLSGRARISAVAEQPLSRLTLDLAKLTVDRVKVNGQPAAMFTQWGSKLHIWPAELLPAGSTVDLLVSYAGNPVPIGGRWGQLGWDELADGVIVASQPNGAPSWFPCNDHPSSKATYQISVTADSAYQVIANGILVAKRRGSSQTTWTYHQPEPMASYLATVQIGRYQIFQLATKPVAIKAAIPARRLPAFNDSFGRQQHMMKLFCRLFGAYPFAGYTVVITDDALEIPLEAQGISIFGSNFIDGRRGSERLIAHELAHQWFGNSVTLKSWRHIWLHEGFACYAEWLWAENSGGLPAEAAARAARSFLLRQPQDLAIGDPGPDRMFDSRVYLRGALTVHALRQQMGDQAFFRLIRGWLSNHRHGTASTEQFLELAASRGGDEQTVRRWLFETALPPEF